MTIGIIFDELLRDRGSLFKRIDSSAGLTELARALIIITAASAAVFGASIGAYRGGVQVVYAAIKVPLVLLLTAAICAPAWTALRAALGGEASLRVDLVRVLGGLATVGLVLSALAPLLLVGIAFGASYHSMTLLVFGCAAFAGLAGVAILVVSRRSRALWVPLTVFLSLFSIVGAQMSWTLRPYLVRPRTPEVPFVRSVEGGFIESASSSYDSARGHFKRDHAPLPGEVEPRR